MNTSADPSARSVSRAWRARLAAGSDAELLVLGDSTTTGFTGDGVPRCQRLARHATAQHPSVSSRLIRWDGSGDVWGSPQSVASGSGSGVLTVWDAGVSGYSASDHISRWAGISDGPTPQLVIVNLGHNSVSEATYTSLCELVESTWAGVAVVCVLQNRKTNDTANSTRRLWIIDLAVANGYGTIDVWDEFGGDSQLRTGWYTDVTHPNSTGYGYWVRRELAALL